MKRILFISTIYRCGEKVYPIVPHLCKYYEVDVLMFNQMSPGTPWYGNVDPRKGFYKLCSRSGANVIFGPGSDVVSKKYNSGKAMCRGIDFSKYDLVILDDNKAKTGWGTPLLCRTARKHGCIVVGTPHGNHEFDKYNLGSLIGDIFDYSFVFGKREVENLIDKDRQDKLLAGGIPSNDRLKDIVKRPEYILVVTSYVEGFNARKKNPNGYAPFNERSFLKSGILDLQKKYGVKTIIKEKSRFKEGLKFSLKGLEKYPGVSVIMDHPDNDELIAGAFCLVSAPSTMCFKAIQLGIPTVLLEGFGMTGNFHDFDGLVTLNKGQIAQALERQRDRGKQDDFITETLSGGLDFTATQIYLDNIARILNG